MLKPGKKYLYFVADAQVKNPGMKLEEIVQRAIAGGVNIVQYRDKINSSRIFYEQAMRLMDICRYHSVPFIINDRVDIALAVKADGVHIGQDDLPLDIVRSLANNMIVGYSVKTVDQAVKGQELGADYLGVGTVFETGSKPDAGEAIGLQGLREIVHSVKIPVIAIGGINRTNAAGCMDAGASGIAVISAISLASDPGQAARDLARVVFR